MLECVSRAVDHASLVTRLKLNRGLPTLASIAATAVFAGVFGTCIGIVASFVGCGGEKSSCQAAVVERLSNSLMPTALSLLIAIPSACAYKYFTNRLELLHCEMENAASELLSYLTARQFT